MIPATLKDIKQDYDEMDHGSMYPYPYPYPDPFRHALTH